MNFPMHKFKKIRSDEQSTTLQHPDGHLLNIAHKPLTPQTLKQLKSIPMAEGGGVTAPSHSGAPDKVERPVSEQSYIQANPKPPKNSLLTVSKGNPDDEALESPEGYADGGKIKGMPTKATSQREDIAVMNAPESAPAPKKEANGIDLSQTFADGGEVADSSNTPETPDSSQPTQQAPVNITINSAGQSPQGLPGVSGATGPAMPSPLEQTGATGTPGIVGTPPAVEQAQRAAALAAPVQPSAQAQEPAPEEKKPAPQQTSGAPGDPFGTEAYYKSLSKGIGEQKAGIQQGSRAEGSLGEAQADLLKKQVETQQQQAKTYGDRFDELNTERKAFQSDIENQHIDPQHYLNSMGTAQKVATGIGLILGGMGGGLMHQQNPALVFLQNQIDRDINSQMADLGKKQNLLSANLEQFGNLKDATDMTRVMQADIVSNQLKQSAAKAQSPLAAARAQQAIGVIDTSNAQALSQIAMRRTLLSGMNSGKVDPAAVVNMVIPDSQRAEANKELTTAQNMSQARDNLMSAFTQLTEVNTLGQRIMSPIQTPKQVEALKGPLLAQLVKDSEGRITPMDVPMIESLFPAPGDNDKTNALKRQRLAQFVSEKMHFPILQTYGINPTNNSGRFNSQGQDRYSFKPGVK